MKITVETKIQADPETVWENWTSPEHIVNWNFASPEWHCPSAQNNLTPGGDFSWRMEAKDGSMGFDYCGKYIQIEKLQRIVLTLDDGREVTISFIQQGEQVLVQEEFEAEDENSAEMQKTGWQAILENFKSYTESNN